MMKKNYFGKIFAIATVFAGLSLTSCNKNDNAIINGQVFEPSNFELVEGGAVINANTPSEVSRMVTRLRQEILKAAENKETFTININAAALNATAGDNTLSFLTVRNGDLVVNFNGTITTDEPLVLESKGVDENQGSYGTAINKVAFNFPAGTSNIDLNVNMPKSSVTIKPTSGSLGINELSAKTAFTTLYLESGITVNCLHLEGGNVVIKNGAKINSVASPYLSVYPEGITFKQRKRWDNEKQVAVYNPLLVKDSVRTSTEYTDADFYYVKSAKNIKREDGGLGYVDIYGTDKETDTEVDITISDGAKVQVYSPWADYCAAVNITGEGNAKIMAYGDKNGDGKYIPNGAPSLYAVKKLTNVTVDAVNVLIWNNETQEYEEKEMEEGVADIDIYLPLNAENCEFITIDRVEYADPFWYNSRFIKDNVVTSTFKDCKITFKAKDTKGQFRVNFPAQTEKRTSFKLNFETCELNNIKFGTSFDGNWEDYDGFKSYIVFDSTKLDGKAITKDTDMISYVYIAGKSEAGKWVETTETFFTIDGVNYKPVNKDEKWILEAVK